MIAYDNKDWLKITFAWKGTSLSRIWPRIIFFSALPAILFALDLLGLKIPRVGPLGHSVIGIALGLLLVFRNSSSYERYWEGRKSWGSIVNGSRNIIRLGAACAGPGDVRELADLVTAYSLALRNRLRGEEPPENLGRLLRPEYRDSVISAGNVPLAISYQMSRWIKGQTAEEKLNAQQGNHLEGLVSQLMDNQGACERILRTPIPFCHASHIKLLLFLYLATLPLVIDPNMLLQSTPIIGMISFGLIGIEEAGVEIEDPFGDDPNDLPVDDICDVIRKDGMEILSYAGHDVSEPGRPAADSLASVAVDS